MRELPRGAMSRREAALFVARVLGGVRLRGLAARVGCAACCRRSRWRSCSGTRWPSATPPTRSCFSAWRWPWRRSAAGLPPAAAPGRSRGCSAWRSACGSAASTSSTPARTSTSIAGTGCARFRRASAWRRAIAHLARACTWPRSSRWPRWAWRRRCRRSISAASPSWRRCSSTSSRSCRADDLSQVKRAFDLNGYVGIVYFAATALALYVG